MRMLVTGSRVGRRPDTVPADVGRLHRSLRGYRPTPLTVCRDLAERWGAAQVAVKVEGDRWGLPSFKVVGTTWAVTEALREHVPADWSAADGLEALRGRLPDLTLAAASEGNHGEALAFVARLVGLRCRVYVSEEVADGVVRRVQTQGAEVVSVPGTYDDAVAACAATGDQQIVVSDTSWPSYERVPRAVATGYSTILREAADQLAHTNFPAVDLVVVPIGVGALASAVIDHAATGPGPAPRVVGIEPAAAACVMASLAADRVLTLPGPLASPLSGLNCGTPSLVAWPRMREGLAAVVALDDDEARLGAARAAEAGLAVGPCAGAVVAAAELLLSGPGAIDRRSMLDLPDSPSVLLLATDGPRPSEPGPIQQTEESTSA